MVPRATPFVWVSWLTGLLSSDDQCRWALWAKAHHTYEKRPDDGAFNLVQWKAEHGDLVTRRARELAADGWHVRVERQNKITLKGRVATLAGQPDIVATKGAAVLIVDAKTGQRKAKDVWQVLVYMLAEPLTWTLPRPDLAIAGEVLYPDGTLPIPADQFTPEHRARILAILAEAGAAEAPARVPSAQECKFCDIAACPDRVVTIDEPVSTGAF